MIHSRSVFSLWLCLIIVFLPALAMELFRPFNTAYTFLFALLVGPAIYVLSYLLCRLCPKQPLLDLAKSRWGHKASVILACCYSILIAFLCTLFIEDFGTRIVHSVMLHSDARFYNVTLLFVSALFARSGLRTLGRMAEILIPLFSFVLFVLTLPILLSTPKAGLLPIPAEALLQFFPGGLSLSFLLGSGGVFFLSNQKIQITEHSKKQCIYTAFLAAVYALLFPLLTSQILGRYLTEQTTPSFFAALRQFKLFGAFGNSHVLIMLPWMIVAFPVCACFLSTLSDLLQRLFSKTSETFRQVLSPIIVLLLLAIRNEWNTHLSLSLWIGVIPLGALLLYGVPILLTILDRRKPRPQLGDD